MSCSKNKKVLKEAVKHLKEDEKSYKKGIKHNKKEIADDVELRAKIKKASKR